MWQSLLKLRALPADTALFCGHDTPTPISASR